MPRTRRYFESGRFYEITIRTKRGLPFPHWALIRLLLQSATARTQRDNKVTLCHFLWMANHAHILAVVQDADACKRFYMELQKKLTDYMKRLLNVQQLDLWEGEPAVIAILNLEAAIDRIRYVYCNPSRANLVENIDTFPGYSSWEAFKGAPAELNAQHSSEAPWVRQYQIQPLSSGRISPSEDARFEAALRARPKRFHNLVIRPNAWMRSFGISAPEDIAAVNQRITGAIKDSQEKNAALRAAERKAVLGADRLRRQPITWEHTPAKHDRRVFAVSSDREARIDYINFVHKLCDTCRELYQAACRGVRVSWPPGVFPSPLPMLANALAG